MTQVTCLLIAHTKYHKVSAKSRKVGPPCRHNVPPGRYGTSQVAKVPQGPPPPKAYLLTYLPDGYLVPTLRYLELPI